MPQAPPNNNINKKKKKGHAPAHQNKFAFYHNPKSKRTAEILERPIQHVCRRCRDKLEWRKQYRKYKPRTVLGKCNICQKKNIHAAYHTICESCTRTSEKARDLLAQWNKASAQPDCDEPFVDKEPSIDGDATDDNHAIPLEPAAVEDDKPNSKIASDTDTSTPGINRMTSCYSRVCAICVKEPALPDLENDIAAKHGATTSTRLKLRERKTLERQKEREAEAKRKRKKKPLASEDEEEDEEDDDDDDENDDSIASETDDAFDGRNAFDGIDEDDEFVKAIGGVDKLLIGNAYQAKLLEAEVKRPS